jgi:cytochrome c55X
MTAVGAFVSVRAGLLVALVVAASAQAWAGGEPPLSRQRELLELLHQDCGACHGMRLTGGLGPPLTASALRERPFESVVATIEYGRPGTPMPPWRRFLSEDEVRWLALRLTSGTTDAR